jgi:hypothetical protein
VDSGKNPVPAGTAIGIAPDGTVHIAYVAQGAKVYHAIRDTSGCWTVEWVNQPVGEDPNAEVGGIDLVVDGKGHYYLVYHEVKDGSIRLVSDLHDLNGTIAGNVTGAPYPSIAIGPNGLLHLVYLDGLLKVPMYAHLDRFGVWDVQPLTERPYNVSGRTSITFDESGRLHVVYTANYGEYIKPPYYGMHYLALDLDEGTWSELEQDIQSNVYGSFDVCARIDFGVYIAYTRKHRDNSGDENNLRTFIAVKKSGEGWVFSLPMPGYYMTHSPSIGITSAGVVNIVGTYPWYGTFCHYRMSPVGKWTRQINGRTGDEGGLVSLVLDDNADLHVAYVNYSGYRIQYAMSSGRPGAPRNMEVIPAVGRFVVNWRAPSFKGASNISHYSVYVLAEGDEYPTRKNTWRDRCTYIYDDVSYGTRYTVWVAAWNDDGQGPSSPKLRVTTLKSPSAPTNINGTEGDEHVLLRWSPPDAVGGSPIIGYRIYWHAFDGFGGGMYWSSLSGSAYSVITLEGPEARRFKHTGLENGMYHIYHVTAVTKDGEGAASKYQLLVPRRLPSAPINLSVTVNDGIVDLDWDPPLDYGDREILSYIVYRGFNLDEMEEIGTTRWRWSDWNLWSPAPTAYRDEDAENGKTYYYYVTAANGLGEGPPSAIVVVHPTVPEPPVVPEPDPEPPIDPEPDPEPPVVPEPDPDPPVIPEPDPEPPVIPEPDPEPPVVPEPDPDPLQDPDVPEQPGDGQGPEDEDPPTSDRSGGGDRLTMTLIGSVVLVSFLAAVVGILAWSKWG